MVIKFLISSQKGGVGKTTLSINLSYAFALSGYRVLLLDADPQGSVGLSLAKHAYKMIGFYDYMQSPEQFSPFDITVPTKMPHFSLVTSGRESNYSYQQEEIIQMLGKAETFFAAQEKNFDICIIDTAAGFFGLGAELIRFSNGIILPQQAEPLGVRSIGKAIESLYKNPNVSSLNYGITIISTMVIEDNEESLQANEAIRSILPFGMVSETYIPRDDIFLKASAKGVPLALLPEGEQVMRKFISLKEELEKKMKKEGI